MHPAADRPRILLATDLSQASELAADWAFDLARRLRGTLVIVSVIDAKELRLAGGRFGPRVDQVRARREGAAQQLVALGKRSGVEVTFLIWEGDPGESIVAAAESEGADLVLVGSRGRRTLGRLLMGSVSAHVVQHAPCPVLVVRAVAHATVPSFRSGPLAHGETSEALGGESPAAGAVR